MIVHSIQVLTINQEINGLRYVYLYLTEMEPESNLPTYALAEVRPNGVETQVVVLTSEESEQVPETFRERFTKNGQVTVQEGLSETHYLSTKKAGKFALSGDSFVQFSEGVSALSDYHGFASDILACHKFSRKQKKASGPKIHVHQGTKDWDKVRILAEAKNRSKELSNGRGDQEGTPAYFEKLTRDFAGKHNLEITVFKGNQLLDNGFRLMHAVGRASDNEPTFVNIKYNGNKDSSDWVAFVGKGVCFDAGGLNIKTTAGMKDMFLDKCGAVACFSAFQAIVEEGVKINLTVSLGWVENFIDARSYRPSDIITSRKGITVEIGNTDAEGRLVLADCMNWTQETYKNTRVLIELSTLTGAMIFALGHRYAGAFTNSQNLVDDLSKAGKQVHEEIWHMPLDDYHRDLVKHKFADITNSSGKSEAGSSQAAAFLENFVEEGVQWLHLDVAGTAMIPTEGTGYGARLLTQYARNYAQ